MEFATDAGASQNVCRCIEEPAIDRLRHAGVKVSISTNGRVLLGANLTESMFRSEAFGWSESDLRTLARNSIEASLANADVKAG